MLCLLHRTSREIIGCGRKRTRITEFAMGLRGLFG
jgi:hypothetical protein